MMGQKTFTANKAIRTLFSGVVRLARGTSLIVGLAVMMALMVGLASSALAGTGVGGVFNLGKTNTVNAITKLAGSVPGASLVVDNNSTDPAATALNLRVEPGKAPMKVDSQEMVANLNADKVDGLDASQLGGFRSLQVRATNVSTPANQSGKGTASCQPGELATGGGVSLISGNSGNIFYFEPGGVPALGTDGVQPVGWRSSWFAETTGATVRIYVVCAS